MVFLGSHRLQRAGGALRATVPAKVARFLGVGEGDSISFLRQEPENTIFIVPSKPLGVIIPGVDRKVDMAFSVSRSLLQKILAHDE